MRVTTVILDTTVTLEYRQTNNLASTKETTHR